MKLCAFGRDSLRPFDDCEAVFGSDQKPVFDFLVFGWKLNG